MSLALPDITVSSQRKVPKLILPEGGQWSERVNGHTSYKNHHHLSKRQTQSSKNTVNPARVYTNFNVP